MTKEENLPPTTTSAEDTIAAGQRRINLIWEMTQSIIAVSVTVANLYGAMKGVDSAVLNNSFFLIIGFYFARTNHTQIGGVGQKTTDTQAYKGR